MAANPFRAIPTSLIDRKNRPIHYHDCEACAGASHAEIAHCDVCSGNGYVEGNPDECKRDDCEVVAAEFERCEREAEEHARECERLEREAAVLAERTGAAVAGFDLGAEIGRITASFNYARRGS